MAQAERKNKQASTVAKELSGMEGYPATVTFEEVCNAVGKSPSARAILTPDGWYTHPESARVRDLGISRLALPE